MRCIILKYSAIIPVYINFGINFNSSCNKSIIFMINFPSSDSTVFLSLSPMQLSEYSVPLDENFTVTCTAMSHDPNVFVLWRQTDGKQNK